MQSLQRKQFYFSRNAYTNRNKQNEPRELSSANEPNNCAISIYIAHTLSAICLLAK